MSLIITKQSMAGAFSIMCCLCNEHLFKNMLMLKQVLKSVKFIPKYRLQYCKVGFH